MSTNFNKGKQRVDATGDVNKSLMIVKAQSSSLTSVENFLRNREWKLFSTTSLKDALTYMIQNQPAFVMISVDHTNKKVRNLAKVLTQAFPCCVIMFAEQSAPGSFQALSQSKAEYLLYPPVTGPAVERTVNKYYKDQATKQSAGPGADRSLNGEEGEDGKMISIKGGGVSAQSLLAQLMSDDGNASANIAGSGADPNDASFLAGNGTAGGPPAADPHMNSHVGHYNPQVNPSDSTPFHHNPQGALHPQTPGHHNPQDSQHPMPPGHYNPQGQGPGGGGPGGSSENNFNGGFGSYNPQSPNGSTPSANGKDSAPFNPQAPFVPEGEEGPGPLRKDDKGGGWVALDPHKKDRPLLSDDERSKATKNHQDSIILKGTKESLEKSVIRGGHSEEHEIQQIDQATNVACIVIESTRFSGYLVAAMGKDRKIDDEFISRIREKLFKFLSDNGEKVNGEENNMNLKIKQVPFEDWAIEYAEFLRKSVHKGDEVAMAFFPHTNVKANFAESANNDMLAISIDDLKEDTPVEFNLYVYLPTNQKYVLYTPRGGKLYGKQKEKLIKQGVSHMHMMKNDVQDFNKYRAQNYLNGKIEEFETKQRIKKAAV